MEIKILGTGCKKCTELYANVKIVLEELKIEATIEKVEDISSIMSFGVMSTPALIIDGKIVVSGRVAGIDEIKDFFS